MSEPYFTDVENNYSKIGETLKKLRIKKALIVCSGSFERTKLKPYFSRLQTEEEMDFVRFSDYTANPDINSVFKAKDLYIKENCQGIIAAGGGSATDLCKCLRLSLSKEKEYSDSPFIPFFVIPTIAGSGSEVTKFAVIYSNQEKLSVSDRLCMPDVVFYDSSLLETLPIKQMVSAFLDAFCHCIESLWSVNSTAASIFYAESALKLLLKYKDKYLENDPEGNKNLQKAAKFAGRAINISQTTAAHAMSYKLTKLFDIPHGISAGLCLEKVWKHIIDHKSHCCDSRGVNQLELSFDIISQALGCDKIENALSFYQEMLISLKLPKLRAQNPWDPDLLANSVNTERLKNSPVPISTNQLRKMYEEILL